MSNKDLVAAMDALSDALRANTAACLALAAALAEGDAECEPDAAAAQQYHEYL